MFTLTKISPLLGAALLLCVAGAQAQSTPAPDSSTAAAAPNATHKPPAPDATHKVQPDATHKVPADSTPAPSGTTNNNPGG